MYVYEYICILVSVCVCVHNMYGGCIIYRQYHIYKILCFHIRNIFFIIFVAFEFILNTVNTVKHTVDFQKLLQ